MRTDKWHDEEEYEIVYGAIGNQYKQHEMSRYEHIKHGAEIDTYEADDGYIYTYELWVD